MKDLFDTPNRDGEAAADRPEAVDELLEDSETLGFREGEPLSSVEYDDYPRETRQTKEIYLPESGAILREIANSDVVHDQEDLAEELGLSKGATVVTKACEIHDINLPEYDESKNTSMMELVDSEGESFEINTNTYPVDGFRVLFTLYKTMGLSVEEIADMVDGNERTITSNLRDHKLL